ncbi:phage integrase family protein [Clostridioides difficile CD160]|nr:phage integrase family protein [Clostridioides difficile CD160]
MTGFIRIVNKKYIVYLEYKDELTGKKKQKNMGSFTKKREANKRLAEVKDSMYKNNILIPNNILFENFLKTFIEEYKSRWSITTYSKYINICNKYVIKYLGKMRVQDIDTIHIQNYINTLSDTLSSRTLKIHLNIMKLAFESAFDLRIIDKNPTKGIDLVKSKKFKNEIYDEEQIIRLLEACKNTALELHINLGVGLGMRISEILGLSWENIDFERKIISIEKITAKVNGEVILKDTKTESSIRKISAPDEIMNLILKHKFEQEREILNMGIENKHNLLFINKKGNPIDESVISHRFRRFLEYEQLPHIRFHDLRHSHVTLLMNSHVPIKVISERVGHSNVNTTLNIYSHVLNEMDREASNKIADKLYKDEL